MNKSELFTTREGIENDHAFIYSSWLRSLYYGDSWVACIPKSIFMTNYHNIIEKLLSVSTIKIACLKEDPNTILAYAVLSNDESCIHYAYCKKPWRKIGLIKGLITDKTTVATELTDIGRSYIKNHSNMIFNPFGD